MAESLVDDVLLVEHGMDLTRRAAARAIALGALLLMAFAVPGTAGNASAAGAPPQRPDRQVIVRAQSGRLGDLAGAVRAVGGHVDRTLRLIDALAATVPADSLGRLEAQPGVNEVTGNAAVTLAGSGYSAQNDPNSLYRVETVIGARRLWTKGFTGQGVDVALIDSGVAPVKGIARDNLVEGPDLTPESQRTSTAHLDTFGHGTHLAGIIGGHDPVVTDVTRAATDTHAFLGVAPDARIVSVKIADYRGSSDVSQVIAGIDWVVEHAHDNGLNIRVLNLSFGTTSSQDYTLDPLAYAAEQAWKHGIVVVVSAGNTGATNGRLTNPAIDPYILSVGAAAVQGTGSTADDTVPDFSAIGDGTRNPDLVAPGVHMQSLRVPGSYVDLTYGDTGALAGRFFRGSGTSQAAAVVTGSAALLLQEFPTLTPDQVKAVLREHAGALPDVPQQAQGAGVLSLRGIDDPGPPAVQNFVPAEGTGSLEAARGGTHLVMRTPDADVVLQGENDIFGAPVDTAALAVSEARGHSWRDGTWNGDTWSGAGWTSSSWASSSWAGALWTSSSWAGNSWSSSSWADGTWSSSSWASSSWASSSWASSCWASSSWASNWSDGTPQSSRWD